MKRDKEGNENERRQPRTEEQNRLAALEDEHDRLVDLEEDVAAIWETLDELFGDADESAFGLSVSHPVPGRLLASPAVLLPSPLIGFRASGLWAFPLSVLLVTGKKELRCDSSEVVLHEINAARRVYFVYLKNTGKDCDVEVRERWGGRFGRHDRLFTVAPGGSIGGQVIEIGRATRLVARCVGPSKAPCSFEFGIVRIGLEAIALVPSTTAEGDCGKTIVHQHLLRGRIYTVEIRNSSKQCDVEVAFAGTKATLKPGEELSATREIHIKKRKGPNDVKVTCKGMSGQKCSVSYELKLV